MPQVNAQSSDQPEIDSDLDVDPDLSEEPIAPTNKVAAALKGKRRRRAATSGVITA
jgi:ribonuclease E